MIPRAVLLCSLLFVFLQPLHVVLSIDEYACDTLTTICSQDTECRDSLHEFRVQCLDSPLELDAAPHYYPSGQQFYKQLTPVDPSYRQKSVRRSGLDLIVDSFEKLKLLKDAIKVIKRSQKFETRESTAKKVLDSSLKQKELVEQPGDSSERDNPAADRQENAQVVFEEEPARIQKREDITDTRVDKGPLFLEFTSGSDSTITEPIADQVANSIQRGILTFLPSDVPALKVSGIKGDSVEYTYAFDKRALQKGTNDISVAQLVKEINDNSKLQDEIKAIVGRDLKNASTISKQPLLGKSQHEFVKARRASTWEHWGKFSLIVAIVSGCLLGVIIAGLIVCGIRRRNKAAAGPINYRAESVKDYQELCRAQISVNSQHSNGSNTGLNGMYKGEDGTMKHSRYGDPINGSHMNMDITTGHAVLSYMEDHLKNENRLNKEWEGLCSYEPDRTESVVASDPRHAPKNRYRDVLPYDHNRVKLREQSNTHRTDYINASYITDVDPRNPDYIATQGPLEDTVSDFWQMVWEQGVVVIVNLTKPFDMGLQQCQRYWPESGAETFHQYEVNLISEHIHCDDYMVRSLYLKNLQTGETRTVTQFQYLTWPDLSVPNNPRTLLEFRRKVNQCYRGHACPVIVHCSNGVGRTGTYILLDMVLNKMQKGAREIDVAATLEHLREQRIDMVKTKQQFEFVLVAVADEVTTILGLPSSR